MAKRQKAKEDTAAEAAALKARAAAAALAGTGEAAAACETEGGDERVDGVLCCLKRHKKKRGAVWTAFELTFDKPRCKLLKENGKDLCDAEPRLSHHRMRGPVTTGRISGLTIGRIGTS